MAIRVKSAPITHNGIRPINLRTDLAALADLIELVFADSMDTSGRAALREMRYLSRMGAGLSLISRMNDMAFGISQGHVWLVDDRLVGNVSVYPANWPADMGSAWIIANVGVHPDFQRRGIARQLMTASMEMIAKKGGTHAILQVDADNHTARRLYRSLGFVDERTWMTWKRHSSSYIPMTPSGADQVYIRHRRRSEWKDEMALAKRIRPQSHGGIGWLRPLHPAQFKKSILAHLNDWLNLHSMERLVIRSQDDQQHLASLWVDSIFGSRTRLTLLVEPELQGTYDDILLNTIVRRYARTPLSIEHPTDETATADVLKKYNFVPQREVIHMRWQAKFG